MFSLCCRVPSGPFTTRFSKQREAKDTTFFLLFGYNAPFYAKYTIIKKRMRVRKKEIYIFAASKKEQRMVFQKTEKFLFPFFSTKRARIYHLSVLFVLSSLFLVIYNPFDIMSAGAQPLPARILVSLSVTGIFTVVATLSMLLFLKKIKNGRFKYHHFFLMGFINLSVSAILYTADDLTLTNYLKFFFFLFVVMLVPYTLTTFLSITTYLFKELLKKKAEGKMLSKQLEEETGNDLIPFVGEYGNIDFYLYKESLLYVEANDNYVNIYSDNNGKVVCNILRSSMKNIEKQLKNYGICRCHRSYIVNPKKIIFAKKEKGKLFLHLSGCDFLVPVSGNFAHDIAKFMGN